MSRLLVIAGFEFRSRMRMISTWVYFLMYAAIAGLWMAAAGGAIGDATISFGGDKILINGSYSLGMAIGILGFTGVTVIASLVGRSVQQDFEHQTYHFFYSAPIAKRDYFFGRFLGACLCLAIVFLGIVVGISIGTHWPGVDSARVLASPPWQSFVRPYLLTMLPNILWLGACFYVLAALTRQMAPVYIGGVLVLVGYMFAVNLLGDFENKTLAALIDPSGSTALDVVTRYWSVAQKNEQPLPLTGLLLWNRLLWLGVGLVVMTIGYFAFRMEAVTQRAPRSSRKKNQAVAREQAKASVAASTIPTPIVDRSDFAFARMLPGLTRLYLSEILRSPRFLTVVLGGVLLVVGNASTMGAIYGTNTYPLTYKVLDLASGLFGLFILIITAIYAGELVWRERDTRIDDITDSTPAPTWLAFLAKLAALFLLQATLLCVVMLCSIGVQLSQGYTRIEPLHYLTELFAIQLPGLWLLAVLALLVHALIDNKYLGHFLVVFLFFGLQRLPGFGYEDRLYLYAARPDVIYSDLNGYGHFLPAVFWFRLYWGAFAVMLLLLAQGFWSRGRSDGIGARVRAFAQRWSATSTVIAVLAGATFAVTGSWIFYNTHVLNPFRSAHDSQQSQADYERRYKPLASAPQPKVVGVDLRVDIQPQQHQVRIAGTLKLVNKTAQPVNDLYVNYPRSASLHEMKLGVPAQLADEDPMLGWHHYHLQSPLEPGESTDFVFDLGYGAKGFRNDGADAVVMDSGTFLNAGLSGDSTLIPSFGYNEDAELESDRERKKFGFEPKPRMHDIDDPLYVQRNGLTRDADFIAYRATVCTSADQLPVTSGNVERDWIDNGRHCIAYDMDTPMGAIYPFLSARYAVRRDVWHGKDGDVAIEIDYQPGHEYNLDRIVDGVRDSLQYFSRHFGPYQHKILRVIEFPRFSRSGGFAESFPNTVPFNEALGFTAKVDNADPKDIDYPYFVTAHEVAHQWWAHQEVPAAVQGAEFVSESLAEYSALMVLKQKYGDARMRRFLKYELDRYLLGRGSEQKQEQPLLRADGAAYVHYQKGSLTLYALQDAIGESAMDDALSAFLDRWRFQGPPYARSRDLIAEFRRVTPAESQGLISDLFENITLYDDRAISAEAHKRSDGEYEVTMLVSAKKIRADGAGNEHEVPVDTRIDIGVLDANGEVLALRKELMHDGENRYTMTVKGEPFKAGIDPLDKLIDRDASDNTMDVTRLP
jgi:ABC-2 type transport system permease protein